MNTILSPKADFVADEKRATEWRDIAASPIFREAAQVALLQYSMRLAKPNTEGPTLAVVGLRLQGAQEVIEELMNLGRHTKPTTVPNDDHLDPV